MLWRRLRPIFGRSCYHPVGRGGAKKAVRDVAEQLGENTFVFRSDVKSYYARFMNDWVVPAPTRRKLRTAIRAVNERLSALKVEQHPDKTFVGRISRGFDFLGYRFTSTGLAADRSRVNHALYQRPMPVTRQPVIRALWFIWSEYRAPSNARSCGFHD